LTKPAITSITALFQKNVQRDKVQEVEETKNNHRRTLGILMEDYTLKVQTGEVDGIRHAKDLIEVMKLDLLLLGEATERTETNTLDSIKVEKIQEVIDENDPAIKQLVEKLTNNLNDINDIS